MDEWVLPSASEARNNFSIFTELTRWNIVRDLTVFGGKSDTDTDIHLDTPFPLIS